MSRTPTEQAHNPVFRELDLSAEVIRIYGTKWKEPELSYEFGERKFYLRTEDAGIYQAQTAAAVQDALLKEDGGALLKEDGGRLLLES